MTAIARAVVLAVVLSQGAESPPKNSDGDLPANKQITAQPLGHGYFRRGDHITFGGQIIDRAGREDLAKFAEAVGHPLTLANNVDADSFTALSEEYAKDKNKVYYKWISPGRFWVVVLPDADPKTFNVLDFNLARDAKNVWRADSPIDGADAKTAQVVHPHWVWKDRHRVYYQFKPMPKADPETFRHLDQAFYRDAKHVYWSDTLLPKADVNTFQTFGNTIPYAVDKNHVWFGKTLLPQLDAKSFKLFHNHVFADKDRVFVNGLLFELVGADPATFAKVAELNTAGCVLFRDKNRYHVYDPLYVEAYELTTTGDEIRVSKPVWFGKRNALPVQAATVSATLKENDLSEPVLEMRKGFEKVKPPTWEKGKLQRMKDAFIEVGKHVL